MAAGLRLLVSPRHAGHFRHRDAEFPGDGSGRKSDAKPLGYRCFSRGVYGHVPSSLAGDSLHALRPAPAHPLHSAPSYTIRPAHPARRRLRTHFKLHTLTPHLESCLVRDHLRTHFKLHTLTPLPRKLTLRPLLRTHFKLHTLTPGQPLVIGGPHLRTHFKLHTLTPNPPLTPLVLSPYVCVSRRKTPV